MRVCAFGTHDASLHPRIRILCEGLEAHGHEIVTRNVPLGVDTAGRISALRSPRGALALLGRLLRSWSLLLWRSRSVGRVDAVLVGYLGVLDVLLARLRWPRTPIVLDHLAPIAGTGADRQLGGHGRQRVLAALDALAERAADLVVVDTTEHLEALPERRRGRAVVVPVGAPERWFRSPHPRRVPPLRVVFFGLYTPLQGAPTIAEALARLCREEVPIEATMIGRGQELESARARAAGVEGITWWPWVEPDELPEVVAAHDVCLGIFGTTEKARRVVPNKVFQGAAAGCAIVTADTAPQRALLAGAARFVPPGDVDGLAATLRALASDEEETWRARDAAHRHALQRFRPLAVTATLDAALRGLSRARVSG